MPMIFFLLLSALSFAQTSPPRRDYVLLGGGGEPTGPTTLFDSELRQVGSFVNRSGGAWNSRAAFNGGHSQTEAALQQNFGTTQGFTQDSYRQMIAHYRQQLTNGSLKRGDQLLLQFSSHGAIRGNERSHLISASGGTIGNYTTGSGSTLVSIDEVQEVINLASEKGVKVALLDFSCHSGASLALSNPNTCVVSAAGPAHLGGGGSDGFGARFTRKLAPGKNLEDIFLDTVKDYNYGFPMISSPAGSAIQDELYRLITPYLHSYSPEYRIEKLATSIRQTVESNECAQAEERYGQLTTLLQQIESTLPRRGLFSRRTSLRPLLESLRDYEDLQRQLRNGLASLQAPNLNVTEQFCVPRPPSFGGGQYCQSVKLSDVAMIDYSTTISNLRTQASSLGATNGQWSLMLVQLYERMNARKTAILNDPVYVQYNDFFKNYPDLSRRATQLSNRTLSELRKVYPKMYQEEARTATAPNPCRDFVL